MSGQGLIPRGVSALFDLINAENAASRLHGGYLVRASYLELYNESCNDLLNPESTNLQLRSAPTSGTFVEKLLQVRAAGAWIVRWGIQGREPPRRPQ